MSRVLQNVAPVLKLLLVVAIIAAWVEANAKWIPAEGAPPPAQSMSKAAGAGNCTPRIDRRNVQRIAPARPPVIET